MIIILTSQIKRLEVLRRTIYVYKSKLMTRRKQTNRSHVTRKKKEVLKKETKRSVRGGV
jgi:hypothetical protein